MPATTAGKAIASRNATTHGLFARDIVLLSLGEDPEGYRQLADEFTAQLAPRNLLERHYVEKIAAASWRLRRLHRWQAQTFTATITAQTGNLTPTGTVQFTIDGTNSGNPVALNGSGQATFSMASLTVGSHSITAAYTAAYNGAGQDQGSLGTLTQTVTSTPAQLLWNKTDGTAALWRVNPDTTYASVQYGPFSGWTARAVADAPDGSNWLLWTNTNGQASLWRVTALTSTSYTATQYGPYPSYKAVSLSVGSDGIPHLLWEKTDGLAALWTISPATGAFTYTTYGPYPGWNRHSRRQRRDCDRPVLDENRQHGVGLPYRRRQQPNL